jgi:hypothetical protein
MAQFLKDTFRGILIPDERVSAANLSAADSSYNQAGPLPGVPEPQADTDLNLEASGTQSASKQLRIATQRGGHPDRGAASFRWKNEADTDWRGWIQPDAITSWQVVDLGVPLNASGTIEATDAHAVTLEDETVGFCWNRQRGSGIDIFNGVRFGTMAADGTMGGEVTVWETQDAITQGTHPCMVVLPSGRVMLFHYLEDVAAQLVQVQVWLSDDDGGTWTLGTSNALPNAIDVSVAVTGFQLNTRPAAKMRVAYSGGQMILLISARSNDTVSGSYEDTIAQYASSDLGFNWDLVEVQPTTVAGTQAEAVPSSNGFEVFYVSELSGNAVVRRKTLASAFIPLTSVSDLGAPGFEQGLWEPGRFTGRIFNDCEVATAGGAGILYVMARGRATSGAYTTNDVGDIRVSMSRSGGADILGDFELMGQGTSASTSASGDAGLLYWAEGAADYPRWLGLTAQAGRLALFHSWSVGPSTRDNSVARMMVGGYSSVTLGDYREAGSIPRRVCWDHTYVPIELPNQTGAVNPWIIATGGTGASDVLGGFLNVDTQGGGSQNWRRTPPGTSDEGIICHFGVQHVSQPLPLEKHVLTRLKLVGGGNAYTVNIWTRTATVMVEDNAGLGIELGNISIDTQTTGVEVLAFMVAAKVTVYAREINHSSDKEWRLVVSDATVTSSGAGTSTIQFGHLPASDAESNWFWINFVSDEYAGGTPYSTGFTNPADLHGAPFSSREKVYVNEVFIRAVDGPTAPGDSWNIDTRYQHPVTNILPSSQPSPTRGWRSTDETEQQIAFSFAGANRYSTLGLWLDGCNWRTGRIEGWDGATWSTLASIDTATGQTTLAYSQSVTSFGVNFGAATTAGRYFQQDEFENGTARITPSIGSAFSRKIERSSAGVWTDAADHVPPAIQVPDVPIVLSSTGTLDLWSPRILIAVHNLSPIYRKFRLVIDATQGTAEGFYKIGQMALGPLWLMSHDYSWGRALDSEPNTELVTYRDGSRSSFKRGANRKGVSFGWGEGVDTTPIQGATPSPDYVLGTSTAGAKPIGYRGDTPSLLTQLSAFTAGPNMPVVYCPSVDAGSTGQDVKTIQGLDAALYGRIVSGVSTDSIVGDESDAVSGELMRISNVRIEEEL